MAIYHDAKLSLGPASELAPSSLAAGEDLVTELDEMASGPTNPGAATEGKTVQPIGAVSSHSSATSDLETTLLSDLKAVSSIFYSHRPLPLSAPPREAPTAAPEGAADAALANARPIAGAPGELRSPALAAAPSLWRRTAMSGGRTRH
jgi:hypothetical protein